MEMFTFILSVYFMSYRYYIYVYHIKYNLKICCNNMYPTYIYKRGTDIYEHKQDWNMKWMLPSNACKCSVELEFYLWVINRYIFSQIKVSCVSDLFSQWTFVGHQSLRSRSLISALCLSCSWHQMAWHGLNSRDTNGWRAWNLNLRNFICYKIHVWYLDPDGILTHATTALLSWHV